MNNTARSTIYVVKHDEHWEVKCEHCNNVIVYGQREGLRIARKHMGELPEGTISDIKTTGKNHRLITKWVWGRDPYPSARPRRNL